MIVSQHAAERYVERVDPSLSVTEASAAMMALATTVDRAAEFGCKRVKLGTGHRLALDYDKVVTVLSKGAWS